MAMSAGERVELCVRRVCPTSGSFLKVERKAAGLVFVFWRLEDVWPRLRMKHLPKHHPKTSNAASTQPSRTTMTWATENLPRRTSG